MKATWLSLTLLTTALILCVAGVLSLFYNTELAIGLFIIAAVAVAIWVIAVISEGKTEEHDEWVVFAATDEDLDGKRLSDLFPRDIADMITKQLSTEPVQAFYIEQNESGVWEKHDVPLDDLDLADFDMKDS